MPEKHKMSLVVQLLIKAIPYRAQIEDLEIYDDCVRLTWRSRKFRIAKNLFVEENLTPGILSGTDVAILLEALLKKYQEDLSRFTPAE